MTFSSHPFLHKSNQVVNNKKNCMGGYDVMSSPYLCPNCKTNRTRFNIIQQQVKSVKLNPQTGDIMEEIDKSALDPFHISYKGPDYRVQCGTCGLIEDELSFIKRAQINQ